MKTLGGRILVGGLAIALAGLAPVTAAAAGDSEQSKQAQAVAAQGDGGTSFDFDTEIDLSDGTLTLRWSRVSADPTSPVTGWKITRHRDSFNLDADRRSYTFTGLRPGQRDDFSLCPLHDNVVGHHTECWSEFVTFGQPSTPPLGLALDPVQEGAARLTWQAPESPGDTDFVAYEWSLEGGRWQPVDGSAAVVSGLTSGDTYDFAVRARTAAGYSRPATARFTAAAAAAPDAPTDVKVRSGNRKALVRWTAPVSGSPITKYRLTIRPQLREWVVPGNRTSAFIRPLQNGREVTVRVRAISAGGRSAKSEPSNTVIPATTPGRVWKTRVRQTKKKLIVTWLRPHPNGAAIQRYRVRFNGTTQTVTTRRLVVRKPARGKYHLRVKAINGVGAGKFSRPFVVRVRNKHR